MPYQVLIDDNFHSYDEDECYELCQFETYEAALAAAQAIVDRSLAGEYRSGMTAKELYERYKDFGQDPFIKPRADGPEVFSAWQYAEKRCKEICAAAPWSQDSYIKAYRFAAQAHRGQTVPGTDLPYIMHVSFVCMEVIAALHLEKGHDENLAVQCALLHDVIEDTDATYEQVQTGFGESVANGVLALSKDKALAKHLQLVDSLRRIRQQPQTVWMVKLADRITNLQPPPSHWTQDKIVHYQEEAVRIHQALKVASSLLASRLLTKIEDYKSYIE